MASLLSRDSCRQDDTFFFTGVEQGVPYLASEHPLHPAYRNPDIRTTVIATVLETGRRLSSRGRGLPCVCGRFEERKAWIETRTGDDMMPAFLG